MNMSLPEPMRDWVEAQTRVGRYSSASDYVRDLIRRDQERASKMAELRGLITEGINGGVSARSLYDLLKTARAQAAEAGRAYKTPVRPIRTSSTATSGLPGVRLGASGTLPRRTCRDVRRDRPQSARRPDCIPMAFTCSLM
jgi:antitoxin ParD1/3/4